MGRLHSTCRLRAMLTNLRMQKGNFVDIIRAVKNTSWTYEEAQKIDFFTGRLIAKVIAASLADCCPFPDRECIEAYADHPSARVATK